MALKQSINPAQPDYTPVPNAADSHGQAHALIRSLLAGAGTGVALSGLNPVVGAAGGVVQASETLADETSKLDSHAVGIDDVWRAVVAQTNTISKLHKLVRRREQLRYNQTASEPTASAIYLPQVSGDIIVESVTIYIATGGAHSCQVGSRVFSPPTGLTVIAPVRWQLYAGEQVILSNTSPVQMMIDVSGYYLDE